jgi:hypothetical protein
MNDDAFFARTSLCPCNQRHLMKVSLARRAHKQQGGARMRSSLACSLHQRAFLGGVGDDTRHVIRSLILS